MSAETKTRTELSAEDKAYVQEIIDSQPWD